MLTLVSVIFQLLRVSARLGSLLQQLELGSVDLSQADVLSFHLQPALRLEKNLITCTKCKQELQENTVHMPNGIRFICRPIM